jgi:DNA topoisomerase-3
MVSDIVFHVKQDRSDKKIEIVTEEEKKKKAAKEKKPAKPKALTCPKCKEGEMLKGKSAWGCSKYKDGCKTLIPFEFMGKKLSDKQIEQLILKGQTGKIKGFIEADAKVDGVVKLDAEFKLVLEKAEAAVWTCPLCKVGTVVKGKAAYGCNNFKNGCRLRIPFEFMGKKLTEKQVETLVLKQKTPLIKGLVNPSSNEAFSGRIVITNDGQLNVE